MIPTSHDKKPDKRRKYDDAFKAEALRLARESRSMRAAARQLGIGERLLYRWQEQQAAAELGSAKLARDPEVRALRAELQRVQRERDILKKALASYYAWRQRRQQPAPAWERAVVRAFQRHGRRYGTRRVRAEVQAEGHRIGRGRIRRVLRAHGLQAQQPRSFVPRTTDSGHGRRVAPNRLLGQPRPTAPNCVWVGDITCLQAGRRLALPSQLAGRLLAQGGRVGRARNHAGRPRKRGPAPRAGRAPTC